MSERNDGGAIPPNNPYLVENADGWHVGRGYLFTRKIDPPKFIISETVPIETPYNHDEIVNAIASAMGMPRNVFEETDNPDAE